ncbi:hypothetical protein OKA05_01580 [Luteolibacter arcticus]|uniref:Uncharacterized protein n=1 Tax=Luteolibacter arcticus TaxID=1581411 RepID=A0ABT3GC63_9BACT|nr:hypothetical protein [Luteolibacter arcticus]MCW1921222.1 hypothetical protein [Luteolibacter arcticus]
MARKIRQGDFEGFDCTEGQMLVAYALNVRRLRTMKGSDDLDWLSLERLYDEGRQLFLRGQHEEAIDRFKRVYEDTFNLRDVAQIVDDYYSMSPEQWVAKYQTQFQKRDT